jgi:hypothetical protein
MSTTALLLAMVAASGVRGEKFSGPNMNGDYLLAPTPNAGKTSWSTRFEDYPGGVESFTFYSDKVSSTYGEVFWTGLPQIPLPADIVKRFKGKGMAVVGFEVDQVRQTPEGDVSLPITHAYNHHYGATLLGAGSRMERVPYDPNDGGRTTLLSPEPGWDRIPVEHTPSAAGLPTSLWCGYSNGGEYRKSYHGLPAPYVQVVESPHAFDMSPMQIDTWNRDEMNLTGGGPCPGPPGRLSALRVFLCKSVLYGAFVWARRALNSRKRRFPARAVVPGPYPQKREAGDWPSGSNGAAKWPA